MGGVFCVADRSVSLEQRLTARSDQRHRSVDGRHTVHQLPTLRRWMVGGHTVTADRTTTKNEPPARPRQNHKFAKFHAVATIRHNPEFPAIAYHGIRPSVKPGVATTEFPRLASLATIRHNARILGIGSTATAHRSIPVVTLRNNWRPYHNIGENPRIVTIRHTCATTIERPGFWRIVTIVHNPPPTMKGTKIAETVTILYSHEIPLLARMRIIIILKSWQR